MTTQQKRSTGSPMQIIANNGTQTLKQAKKQVSPKLDAVSQLGLLEFLQCSLDIEEVFESFFAAANKIVALSGLRFELEEKGIDIQIGNQAPHSMSLNISAESSLLGTLRFARRKRFSDQDIASLENFTALLIAPLRNALKYREALNNSLIDPLTGIGNRAAFDHAWLREFDLAKRNRQILSIIICDLDHFKNINDTYGHTAGDSALAHASRCMQNAIRKTDQIFRYGGEEFVVILPNTENVNAMLVAERIRQSVCEQPAQLQQHPITLTSSFGVASLQTSDGKETLFERADSALYVAKQRGRNCCKSGDMGTVLRASQGS